MTCLTGEIKQVIHPLHKILHRMFITNIRDVNPDLIFDRLNVPQISPILWDEAVNNNHLVSVVDKTDRQVGADETQPACDQYFLICE